MINKSILSIVKKLEFLQISKFLPQLPIFYYSKRRSRCSIRALLWKIFYISGFYITVSNIYRNYRKFASFDSVILHRHLEFKMKKFPKIIICSNSIHSKYKGKRFQHSETLGSALSADRHYLPRILIKDNF